MVGTVYNIFMGLLMGYLSLSLDWYVLPLLLVFNCLFVVPTAMRMAYPTKKTIWLKYF